MIYAQKPNQIDLFRYGIDPSPDWFVALTESKRIDEHDNKEWAELYSARGREVIMHGDYVIKTENNKTCVIGRSVYESMFSQPVTQHVVFHTG